MEKRKMSREIKFRAWDVVDDKTKLIFMPDFSDKNKPTAIFNYPKDNI